MINADLLILNNIEFFRQLWKFYYNMHQNTIIHVDYLFPKKKKKK